MGLHHSPQIVTDGLIFFIDPANSKSYPGSGSSIASFVSTSSSSLTGTYGYDNTTYSSPVITLNGDGSTSDGQINCSPSITANLSTLASANTLSVMFAAKKNYYGRLGNNNGNSQLFQGARNGYTSGWRIAETSQGTPGNAFTANHSWSFGYNDIRKVLTVNDSGSTNRMCIAAYTVSSTTITGFCNGNFTTALNNAQYVDGLSEPRISFTGAGNGSWSGFIGFFSIYNRTLSDAEILQNFNALRGRFNL